MKTKKIKKFKDLNQILRVRHKRFMTLPNEIDEFLWNFYKNKWVRYI